MRIPNLKIMHVGPGEEKGGGDGRGRNREPTVGERARQHRTSIVDIDIIIVHRKAGHVSARVQPWVLYRECVLSTGSRAARKVMYREFLRARKKGERKTFILVLGAHEFCKDII